MSGEFLHCSQAKLSGAQLSTFFRADSWAPGPNCPLVKGGQLGPGAQLFGAQLSGAQLSGAQLA